jgi:hypothetical protein
MQEPKEKIIKEVQDRLDVCRLMADTISIMRNACGDKTPLTLHLDPHQDLLNYHDIQIISYLCHSCEVPLSLAIGGCEANRDLQELASLSAQIIQASCIESTFALSKLILSYDRIYNTLEVSKKPSITLSLNTPGCLICLDEILASSASSPISTLLIDRNALSVYSLDDGTIASMLEDSIQVKQARQRIKIGICGGISPGNVEHLCAVYKPDLVCTKMFIANALGLSSQTFSYNIISALLVLEARILELILLHRNAISSIITMRRNSLVSYIQASTINQIINAGE